MLNKIIDGIIPRLLGAILVSAAGVLGASIAFTHPDIYSAFCRAL